jgi:hypothetical protein
MNKFFILPLFLIQLGYVSSHSWLQCTNYKITSDNDKNYFNASNCLGRSRCGWNSLLDEEKSGFGTDSDLQFTRDPNACQCYKDNAKAYTKEAPMSHYDLGQTVCLAYPAKNHVAENCKAHPNTTNEFIPDGGITIAMSALPNTETYDVVIPHQNGIHQKGKIDYKGYQNCPKFCEEPDKALCTICFKLGDDIPYGTYSLHWKWEFNPNEYYVTCWEATIGTAPCDDDTPIPSTTPKHTYKPHPTPASTKPTTITPVPTVTETPTEVPSTPVPTVTEPVTEIPTEVPTTPVPTVTEPVTEVPTTPVPTVTEPVTEVPSTPVPTVTEPVTETPTEVPSTPVPTVTEPVTEVPTTPVPTPASTTMAPPTQDDLIHLLCGGFNR